MRFDAEEAMTLADELTAPRWVGAAGTAQAAARLGVLLREAGYEVSQSAVHGGTEPVRPLVGFAFAAALAGVVLELSPLWEHPTGPRELAMACAGLVVVGLLERRVQRGVWGGSGSVSLRATDPHASASAARLVLATPLETPSPPSSRRVGTVVTMLQALWLALLWLPCLLGDARTWLTDAGPELLQMLAVIALVPGLDSWSRRPSPYPGDNRSGPALAVAVARSWPRSMADQVALEVRLEPFEMSGSGRVATPTPRTMVVVLDSPGVGGLLQVEGGGPAAELATASARDLWLPLTTATQGEGARRALRVGDLPGAPTVTLSAGGVLPPDGRPDPRLLQATAQLLQEMALRWARAEPGTGADG